MTRLARVVFAVWVVCLVALVGSALAQDSEPVVSVSDDAVLDVAKSLYCPVCPNEPLDTCQTLACVNWREDIRTQLAQGRSKDEIIADFVARYGERASAIPLDPGLRALSTVTPYVLAVLALGAAVLLITRWRRAGAAPAAQSTTAAASPAGDLDRYRAMLEEDLKR
ncbi:MAG: cytochrome c-type biogenesis protein CcmH [Pleurocapsa minor GSE-CHR-MK-17-07R]|jgi:cytochrome c-type biogenesis protein CcmH|nr:cytochrome c-type biogenesis protein CcmH [Pleurocapsa minor GSE-CHR-MK 17-07R]